MTSHFNGDGAALPVCPPFVRKPPLVEMPPNQIEPWIDHAEAYHRRTGMAVSVTDLMLAAVECGLVLCPERRSKPR